MQNRFLQPPQAIIDFIENHHTFYILGHNEPDGDCLGSQMGIEILLKQLGKKTSLHSPGPFRRPEIQEFEALFSDRLPLPVPGENRNEGAAVLIMDCSTMERIGEDLKADIAGLPLGVLDHHAAGEDFGEVRWIVPESPAVTLMVQSLFQAFELPMEKEAAETLFLGLATDTGYFRHLDAASGDTFTAAGDLVKAGANPKAIFHRMTGNRSFESRILLGKLLARTKSYAEGRILVTWETLDEKKEFGPENRDSDILYQQLQGIRNSEVILLIREESEELCSVGLRSLHRVDVGALAGRMGGGGHPRAAGFNTYKNRDEIIAELLGILLPEFEEA